LHHSISILKTGCITESDHFCSLANILTNEQTQAEAQEVGENINADAALAANREGMRRFSNRCP